MGFDKKSIVGITMGDLNGIGAEIILKALSDSQVQSTADFIIYGRESHLQATADSLGIEKFWTTIAADKVIYKEITGVVLADYARYNYRHKYCQPDAESGKASLQFCNDAIDAAIEGKIDAIVTAPINKVSWKMAGGKWPGHTELLAEKCGTDKKAMMFVAGKMRLALVTIHEALFDLQDTLDIVSVSQSIRLLNQALTDYFGITNPSIAVAALNPHAGEQGRFGDEEIRIITPAIDIARSEGINASGPFPADTMFLKASRGEYDGVIAMYHDQGMIPIKLMAFGDAVNVTIGLPIVRTSPAHGTAFDIAGEGKADASSMKRAIEVAIKISKANK